MANSKNPPGSDKNKEKSPEKIEISSETEEQEENKTQGRPSHL